MSADAQVVCAVATRDRLGETPLWCERTRKLWWIDIEEPKLQSFDPATGAHEVFPMDCTYLGSLALTESGRLLIALDLTLHLFDAETGALETFCEVECDIDSRLNDGRVDAAGRFWVGTMDNELHRGNGALYRIDPDGTATKMFGDVIVTNGIAIAPDNRTLYFTDTRRFTTFVFDVDPVAGTLANRRVFADYTPTGDRPDGATMDADGRLWQAFFAGRRVVRYGDGAAIAAEFPVPVNHPTCICFGGPDFTTLYITTGRKFLSDEQLAAEPLAGSVLAIEGVGKGAPENRFAV